MESRNLPRLACALLLVLLSGVSNLHAGGSEAMDYVREFLMRYPRFEADGVMTSTLAGNKTPYRCRIEISFEKGGTVKFLYNTDGAKNIIPYDYLYEDQQLTETVYSRDRSETISEKTIGAPTRTLFNFVADLIREAEEGAGFNSLVFNGLMSVQQKDLARRTQITLERRLPVVPVKTVHFIFDDEQRLRSLHIIQSDGSEHRIELRRFRAPRPADDSPDDHPKPQPSPSPH